MAGSKRESSAEKAVNFLSMTIAVAFVAITGKMASDNKLKFLQPKGGLNSTSLDTYQSRLEFTSKYWILPLTWLIVYLHVVMLRRRFSSAANPLAGNEKIVEASRNILTNSFEQFTLSIFSQVVVLHYLTPLQTLTMIPLMNALFLIGRVTFWLGYPKVRLFGMGTTLLPTTIAFGYAAQSFARQF